VLHRTPVFYNALLPAQVGGRDHGIPCDLFSTRVHAKRYDRGVRVRCCFWIAAAFLSIFPLQAADRSVEPIISHIRRESVDSSALATVGYSKRLRALEIEFRDGLVYRYLEVPLPIYRELLSAESKARFYNRQVRGKYRCLRVKSKRAR
jgi:hypothetical protein